MIWLLSLQKTYDVSVAVQVSVPLLMDKVIQTCQVPYRRNFLLPLHFLQLRNFLNNRNAKRYIKLNLVVDTSSNLLHVIDMFIRCVSYTPRSNMFRNEATQCFPTFTH